MTKKNWKDRLLEQVKYKDIIYLKAEGNGVRIIVLEKKIWLWQKIKNCEVEFPDNFIRVHRSYLVNLDYVEEIISTSIRMSNNDIINVGNTRLEEVKEALTQYAKNHS